MQLSRTVWNFWHFTISCIVTFQMHRVIWRPNHYHSRRMQWKATLSFRLFSRVDGLLISLRTKSKHASNLIAKAVVPILFQENRPGSFLCSLNATLCKGYRGRIFRRMILASGSECLTCLWSLGSSHTRRLKVTAPICSCMAFPSRVSSLHFVNLGPLNTLSLLVFIWHSALPLRDISWWKCDQSPMRYGLLLWV